MKAWGNSIGRCILIYILFIPHTNALNLAGSEFSPFVQKAPNGNVRGPFYEMVKDICSEMKEPCKFSVLPNKRLKFMVNDGRVDGGFAYGWNEERAKYLYYSVPFMLTEYGLFVSKTNTKKINSVKDIQGYTVGVSGPKSNMAYSLKKIRDDMVEAGLNPIKVHEGKDTSGADSSTQILNLG